MERRDLDLANLKEIRQPVVDPVLAAMFAPGKLTFVHLSFDHPPGSWSAFGDTDDGAWLQLRAGTRRVHPSDRQGRLLAGRDQLGRRRARGQAGRMDLRVLLRVGRVAFPAR